jgi:hypothetical protein
MAQILKGAEYENGLVTDAGQMTVSEKGIGGRYFSV